MFYLIQVSEYGNYNLVVTDTKGESLYFDLNDFLKDTNYFLTIFELSNEYFSNVLTPQESQELFNKFKNYQAQYSNSGDSTVLEQELQSCIDLLNYERFKHFVRSKAHKIPIPELIQDEFIFDPDMNVTKEKTYIRQEYVDLIALISFIRTLAPLYLDFYSYAKNVTTHYLYRLYMVFRNTSLENTPEIEKLKIYTQANYETIAGTNKNEHLILEAGLSDDDMLDSLIAEIIFNKLISIDFLYKKCNVVSFIFQTIKYKNNFAATGPSIIRGKASLSESVKEDISYFEDYRKISDISIGTIVEIQHSLSKLDYVLRAYQNFNFDLELYYNNLNESIAIFDEHRVSKLHMVLLGWFYNKIINPRALYYIEYRKVVELLVLAKTILQLNNQLFISTLLSSYKSENSSFINIMLKNNIKKERIKDICKYYSFVFEEGKQSVIEKTILEVIKDITSNVWVAINPPSEAANFISREGIIVIPNNIVDIVIDYIEFVNHSTTAEIAAV